MLSMLLLLTMTSVAFAETGSLTGSGTEDAPYLITDAADFAYVAANVGDFDGKYLALGADITLTKASFAPIGTKETPFKGIFDGAGKKITGSGKLGTTTTDDYGLFGAVENATITNLTVTSLQLDCREEIGIVAGYAENSQISHITVVSSSITADAKAGGIVGYLKGGSVTDCKSAAKVSLYKGNDAGGIVGRVEGGQVLRCINTGIISAKKMNCGGIVGYCDGTVSHCINNKTVTSTNTDSTAAVAGIAGYLNGEISFCGNAGKITSALECAGIFCASGTANVSFCYNAGVVESGGSDRTIGFIGDEDTVENCIGVDETVTDAALASAETYEGWDFDEVWFEPGDYHAYPYPVLKDCNFHTFDEGTALSELSCTNPEIIRYSCTCGFYYDDTTAEALGHDWDDGEVTTPPTCIDKGVKTFTCTRCDATKTEELEADPEAHDYDENNICKICGEEKPVEVKKSFFQKIADFFKMIFDWIRGLFGIKKEDA